jgi:hypothetical protein
LLALAREEGRVLITEDKDFGELVFLRGLPHPGEAFEPRMAVAFGESQKQAFHLDASAFPQKTACALRAETDQTFHQQDA